MDSENSAKSRPVGGTEFSWCRAVPGGTGITVLAILLSHPLHPSLLQTALHKLQNSHPVLTSTLSPNPHPHLSPSPSPTPLQISDLPPRVPSSSHPPSVSPLHLVLEHELNLNPWALPDDSAEGKRVFYSTLYETPEPGSNRSVLALRFHTSVCDRTAGIAILKELLGLMGKGEEEEEEDAEGNEGIGEVNLGIEDLIPKKDTWKPFWAKGRDLVGYSMNGLRSTGLRFEDAGSNRSSELVRLVMGAAETRKLLDACKAKGVKLCGALASAGLIAAYSSKNLENDQPETYSMVTLVDCRRFLDPVLTENHVGFYYSAILNTHTITGGEGLWEVAIRCHSAYSNAMSNRKHLTDIGELNFLMCKAIDNPHLTPSSALRTSLISVFEEPVLYESSALHDGLEVEDYVGCASIHGVGPSVAVFDTIRDGQLDCACVYPSPLHSRKQITELVENMKRILIEGCIC